MVKRQRRHKYGTQTGSVTEVILTQRQHKMIKSQKVITIMVNKELIKILPPTDRKVAREIAKLQAKIRELKKGNKVPQLGTIIRKELNASELDHK